MEELVVVAYHSRHMSTSSEDSAGTVSSVTATVALVQFCATNDKQVRLVAIPPCPHSSHKTHALLNRLIGSLASD